MRFPLALLGLILAALALFMTQQQTANVRSYGEAKIGGAFNLTDIHGRNVNDGAFRGRLMLVYMGYGNCPDICPLTLATISEALKNLGPDADKVAAIFISLDPARDTPQALAAFLSAFDPRIVGLTGSQKAIDGAAGAYRAYFKKSPTPGTGSYLIDHSGFLYLMDKQGKYIMHFDTGVTAAQLAQAIKQHL